MEKFFLFWVAMNIQKDRKAKLESAYSFMLKYCKIAVCLKFILSRLEAALGELDERRHKVKSCLESMEAFEFDKDDDEDRKKKEK